MTHVHATPFAWIDPAALPRRQFLYGQHLIRGHVAVTVAPGGVGKSSLTMVDALAMVLGRDLIGSTPHAGPLTAWLFNLEDPADEMQRRITAAALRYGIEPADIEGALYLDSGRDQPLTIARQDRQGTEILTPVVDELVAELQQRGIDVLIVDPLVSCHSVPENDNGGIDAVAKEWARVAHRANCAIELVHHVRKSGEAEITAESARGAGALINAARAVRVLNRMAPDEAARAGLESHRGYFRVGLDKLNLSAAPEAASWFRIASVELANGDSVGVVEPWQWPDPFADITVADLRRVQEAIDGKALRQNVQARDWVGHTIAEVLALDLSDASAKGKVKAMLAIWLKTGALVVGETRDSQHRMRPIIEVGTWAE